MTEFNEIDSFGPLKKSTDIATSYTYSVSPKTEDDVLYVGTNKGAVLYFPITRRKRSRVDELSISSRHHGTVTCLTYIFDKSFLNDKNEGFLISGSADRSIKIWYPHGDHNERLVQTLYGHDGTISSIVSGMKGMIISSSIDGGVKVWIPQKNRNEMKFPFFECTFSVKKKADLSIMGKINWTQSLAVRTNGEWCLYVTDSDGSIDLYRKGSGLESEAALAEFTGQLDFFKRWQNVHSLGVNKMIILDVERLLITTSYDCSCKVSDCATGEAIINIKNPHACMFQGIVFDRLQQSFIFTDELGYISCYSWSLEKYISDNRIDTPESNRAEEQILKSHKDPILGEILALDHKRKPKKVYYFVLKPAVGVVTMVEGSKSASIIRLEGHNDAVLSVCPMVLDNACGLKPKSRISPQEDILYSMDRDTIICWSERDQRESFQMKHRGRGEITVAFVIWHQSLIVTGHDDGRVCLWNADSSDKVTSSALKSAVSAIVIAHARQSARLVASDFSGQIAIWNLSLLARNPTILSLEGVVNGYHDPEDPGILSLAYDWNTGVIFSGGDDCSIQAWNLMVDNSTISFSNAHTEPVCSIECNNNYLVTGDMDGDIVVWLIGNSNGNVKLNRILLFPSIGQESSRAIFTLLNTPRDSMSMNMNMASAKMETKQQNSSQSSSFPSDLWLAIGRSQFSECVVWNIYATPVDDTVDNHSIVDIMEDPLKETMDFPDEKGEGRVDGVKEDDMKESDKANLGDGDADQDQSEVKSYWEPFDLQEGQIEDDIEYRYALGRGLNAGEAAVRVLQVHRVSLEKREPTCLRLSPNEISNNNNNFESKTSDNDPMLNTDLNRTPHKLYVGTSGGGVIIAKF